MIAVTYHETQDQLVDELLVAGHALYREKLVTAFGHVSVRVADDRLLVTPPVPLGQLTPGSRWTELEVGADALPPCAPREAWIHLAIARRRPDVRAICRAQPPVATALASAGVPIVALHGQGSFVGSQVPVFDDAVLVRNKARAVELAQRLGGGHALLLRGNGAVTVGANIGEAVARMWVLEASAHMNSVAAAAGKPMPLSDDEQEAWRGVSAEILGRIWADLASPAHP
jgi:HCOMODA/2-hydroxy-3-carboxy-muconic semialdehyde decarboxylase